MKAIWIALVFLGLLSPRVAEAEEKEGKTLDGKFWAVTGFMVGATIFDFERSFHLLDKHEGRAKEANAKMAPMVSSGRLNTYAFTGAVNTGVALASYGMKRSKNPVIRKLWWTIPTMVAATHIVAGGMSFGFTINH